MENFTKALNATFENSTGNPAVTNGTLQFKIPTQLISVYIGMGTLGIASNCIAFAIVVWSKKINSSLKVFILSLVLNDLCFMLGFSSIAVSIDRGGGKSDHPTCWFGIYIATSSALHSYLIITEISVFNYLAVFRPFKIKLWTARRDFILFSALLTVGVSVIIHCMNLAIMGLSFPAGKSCLPYMVCPRRYLIYLALIPIMCSSVILVLNSRTINKIIRVSKSGVNSSNSAHRPSKASSMLEESRKGNTITTSAVKKDTKFAETPGHCHVGESNGGKPVSMVLSDLATVPSKKSNSTLSNNHRDSSLESAFGGGRYQSDKVDTEDSHGRSRKIACASNNTLYITSSMNTLPGPRILEENLDIQNSNVSQTEIKVLKAPFQSDQENTQKRATHKQQNLRSQGDSRVASGSQARQRALRKTSITLSILTLWCCLFTLPFAVYTLIVGTMQGRREEVVENPIGSLSIITIVLNALSNPVLYAWRLVDWSELRARLANLFSGRKSSRIPAVPSPDEFRHRRQK